MNTVIKKNDVYDVIIDAITTDGNGVGRIGDYPVFVPFTCIGDKVQIIIVKSLKKYGFGKIKEMYSPSKERIENDCNAYARCGGCCFRHMSYEEECRCKEEFVRGNLRKIARLQPPILPIIPSPSSCEYRNKAQYPIRKVDGKVCVGFFAKRSHDVISAIDCKLQPHFFAEIANSVRDFIQKNNIEPYNEETGKGIVRHLFIRNAEATGEVMVCLVVNSSRFEKSQEFSELIKEICPSVTSIVLNINTKRDNVILGKKCITIWGRDYITDILCGNKINISPLSFYQVNRNGAEKLYKCAENFAELKGDETILDLYCGTGTIGLSMAKKVKKLIGVEIIPQAIDDAKINADINNIQNAEFICDDAGGAARRFAEQNMHPDVIFVDPPRKGCSIDVIEAIEKMSPQKIVMVSCDSATMSRDCALLCEKGYELQKVQPVDMFPRTGHVETVVLMTYCGGKAKNEG